MKDEIKEILEYISNGIYSDVLMKYNFIELENYIDSLQQENVNLKGEVFNLKAELIQMQDELKQAKSQASMTYIDYLEQEWDIDEIVEEELESRKDKINKAIDKIKDIIESNNSALSNLENTIVGKHELLKLVNYDYNVLLNILQGEQNEK